MTNKAKKIKHISIFLSLISTLIIFSVLAIFLYPSATKHKFAKVDKNSLEFFVEDNSLNETFDKIKNQKYDEIDLVDKKKVQNIVNDLSEKEYNVSLGESKTQVSLKEFLKADKSTHNHYLSDEDKKLTYLTAFYKVAVEGDKGYSKYIDKPLNEKTIENIRKNKEKGDLITTFIIDGSVLFVLLFFLFRVCLDEEFIYEYIRSLSVENVFGIKRKGE